ncbi:MAG: glycosyltransferase [Acidobacteriaceae bacterium]|nr:glycosyltransferase [Acidobacteriaceae bacterium]
MSTGLVPSQADASNEYEGDEARPRISILIPAYGAAASLRKCLESLARFAPERSIVFVLDDATPDSSVREACEAVGSSFPRLRYVRSEANRGFVGTCNWGFEHLREPNSDLLLLNSDTELTAGSLEEMQDVLYLHERHAVVTPRSNNATIFSIPEKEAGFDAEASFAVWQRMKHSLPRYQPMPTAHGFCMLIKAKVLDRFQLFDEIYAPGYNEENDFVCRINRYGYSAVVANRAYVYHHESSSFGPRRAKLEEAHREILDSRYPEYGQKIADYDRYQRDPVERFAVLCMPHRPRILYDLFHLPAAHTGTSNFGLNLLRELSRLFGDEFELHVGLYQPERFFAHELAGYRIFEDKPGDGQVFDLAFKPCQISSWTDFRRMSRLAPRVSYCLQDLIGVRCDYIGGAALRILLQKTAELSDCVFTISDFTQSDFAALYGLDVPMRVVYHGTNFGLTDGEFRSGEYVLVLGNSFVHKGVMDAVQHLDPAWPVVVLGGEEQPATPNVRWLASGNLSRQHMRELFANAGVLVYPSHYEGFGLPIIDALALRKPVVVLDSAVNRELASLVDNPNLYRIDSIRDMRSAVAKLLGTKSLPSSKEPRRWRVAAQEYFDAFREMLNRDFDVPRIRKRWDVLRTLDSMSRLEL